MAAKIAIQKTAKATDDLIGNKIAEKITRKPKDSKSNAAEKSNNSELNEKSIETQKEYTNHQQKVNKLLMN